MLEKITEKFVDAFRGISGKASISEKNVEDAIEQIKMALLEADVNICVVRRFVNSTLEEARGEKVLRSVSPGQQFVKIVHDKMVRPSGGRKSGSRPQGEPDTQSVILLLRPAGVGKTTTAAKLAYRLKNKGQKSSSRRLRPRSGRRPSSSFPCSAARSAWPSTRRNTKDPVRGRRLRGSPAPGGSPSTPSSWIRPDVCKSTTRLMAELAKVRDAVNPLESLLVADAMTRSGRGRYRQGLRREDRHHGRHPQQVRLRCARRRGLSLKSVTGKGHKIHRHIRTSGRA